MTLFFGQPGPQGETGAQGPTGPQGIQGPKGDSINWRSTWISGTSYLPLDAVSYNGSSYICIGATNSNFDPSTDTDNWSLLAKKGDPGSGGGGGTSINWRNAWVSGAAYSEYDAVSYNGSSYINILSTSGVTAPDVDSTHWSLLAQKGATGPKGDTGDQGPQGIQGPKGDTGDQGPGLATGGATGQYAVKNSNTDYDVIWHTLSAHELGLGAIDSPTFAGLTLSSGLLTHSDPSATAAGDYPRESWSINDQYGTLRHIINRYDIAVGKIHNIVHSWGFNLADHLGVGGAVDGSSNPLPASRLGFEGCWWNAADGTYQTEWHVMSYMAPSSGIYAVRGLGGDEWRPLSGITQWDTGYTEVGPHADVWSHVTPNGISVFEVAYDTIKSPRKRVKILASDMDLETSGGTFIHPGGMISSISVYNPAASGGSVTADTYVSGRKDRYVYIQSTGTYLLPTSPSEGRVIDFYYNVQGGALVIDAGTGKTIEDADNAANSQTYSIPVYGSATLVYNSGASCWRIFNKHNNTKTGLIRGNNLFSFQDVITASAVSGTTTHFLFAGYTAGVEQFHVTAQGNLYNLGNATVGGSITSGAIVSTSTGSFTGALTAASSTFGGAISVQSGNFTVGTGGAGTFAGSVQSPKFNNGTAVSGSDNTLRQSSNGNVTLALRRQTDSSPTGTALDVQDATGSSLASIGVDGKVKGVNVGVEWGFSVSGNGSAIVAASSDKVLIQAQYDYTVQGWAIGADASGSIQFDIKTGSSAGSLSSIVASAPPNLSSAQTGSSSTLTGWTTAITAGQWVEVSVTSASTVKKADLVLKLKKA